MLATIIFVTFISSNIYAREAEPVASLPYRLDYGGLVTVEVTVNGDGPYDFIIDTGATFTSAFENLAVLQKFSPLDKRPKRVLGLAQLEKLQPFIIGDISVAGLTLQQHEGVVFPDWHEIRRTPQGVLGLDFLEQYLTVVNNETKRIEFFSTRTPSKKMWGKWQKIPVRKENFGMKKGHLFVIDAQVQGIGTTFILDLGAELTHINNASFDKISQVIFDAKITPNARESVPNQIVDVFGSRRDVRAIIVKKLKAGAAQWYKQLMVVYDPFIFSELGVADQPYGLFGMDLVKGRSFALDFTQGNLYIE